MDKDSQADDFAQFDHHARDVRIGAEDLWTRMRACPGLAHSDKHGGFHVVTRFADLAEAALKAEVFASGQGITIPEAAVRSLHIPAEVDPPIHKAYRALLTRFLTREKVGQMEPDLRTLATRLFDAFKDETHIDFVKAFARPFPVYASLAIIGLPSEDAALLDDFVIELHEEVATGVRTGAAAKLTQYVEDAVLARKTTAHDADEDIMSSVLLGQVEGRPLTLEEQVSMVRLLLIGGFDSTAIALATAAWWLARHPDDAQRLRDEAELMETAIEEVVRFASPASYLRRTVTRDVELGGCPLHKGDRVLLSFAAANRDPDKFEDPDRIVLDRSPNNHAGFGLGAHHCVGSFLARLEIRIMLEELLGRYASLRLDPHQPVKLSSGGNQGITALPLILG